MILIIIALEWNFSFFPFPVKTCKYATIKDDRKDATTIAEFRGPVGNSIIPVGNR